MKKTRVLLSGLFALAIIGIVFASCTSTAADKPQGEPTVMNKGQPQGGPKGDPGDPNQRAKNFWGPMYAPVTSLTEATLEEIPWDATDARTAPRSNKRALSPEDVATLSKTLALDGTYDWEKAKKVPFTPTLVLEALAGDKAVRIYFMPSASILGVDMGDHFAVEDYDGSANPISKILEP